MKRELREKDTVKKKTALKFFTAAAVLAAGGIALAPGASASASSSSCAPGKVCIYEDINFHGGYKFFNKGTNVSTFNTLEQVFSNGLLTNDKISSIVNNTNRYITVYSEANFRGHYLRIPPHKRLNDLRRYGLNDAISSLDG
jgi:Peptidase inhibitor family I36